MHVTLDAAAADGRGRHPVAETRTASAPRALDRAAGATWLAVAVLLIVVSLSLADGLVGGSVAYERDTTVFYFPLMRWVAEQLHQGTFPLWTPQVFGGYPIFADGEIGLSYPPVLLALLVLPAEQAFVFLRLLHLSIAALGTFALARVWGLPRSSSALAGTVFTLGNFLQAQIHHENIVRTAAWLPLILALVELALRCQAWPRRVRWTVLAGLCLGIAGLGLHSQMLAIDLLVLAGYAALRWWAGPLPLPNHGAAPELASAAPLTSPDQAQGASLASRGVSDPAHGVGLPVGVSDQPLAVTDQPLAVTDQPQRVSQPRSLADRTLRPRDVRLWRRTLLPRFLAVARVCLPVVLLGLGVAAVQLVPLIELAGFSPRGAGIPYSDSAAYSLTIFGLAQLLFPFVFRGPGNLQWGLWTHWESYLYVGLAPLVLAVFALAVLRKREIVGWGILAAVGTIVALGQYSPLNLHYLLWLLPGLSGLRAPGRFTIVVILSLAMLAAYGLAAARSFGTVPRVGPLAPVGPVGTAGSVAWAGGVGPRLSRRLGRVAGGSVVAVLVLVLGGHLALQLWPAAAQWLIDATYLIQSRDSYPLTAADVYAGLLWSTDITNVRVLIGLLGLIAVIALLVAIVRWRLGLRWSNLLVAVTALDLLVFAWGIHPRAPLDRLAAEPKAVAALEGAAQRSTEPVRILASPVLNQVSADRLAPFGLQEANGYSSLQFSWHRDYLQRVLEADDDLLDLWNVRYVVDPATYGALPSNRGVAYLTGQTLLHGPAGGAASHETFDLAPGQQVSELRLVTALMGAVELDQDTPVANLVLRDSRGEITAFTQLIAGHDTMEWAYDVPAARPFVRHQRVEVAGLAFETGGNSVPRLLSFASKPLPEPVSAATLTIDAVPPRGELAVYGAAIVHEDGTMQQLFGRSKDKYREVYRDAELRVVENMDALPRAFLVGQARWASSVGASLGEMIHRPFDPRQEVILAADAAPDVAADIAAQLPAGSAGVGTARVVGYGANEVRVSTSTPDAALLVLSDTYYPGWRAFVDGQERPLVRGDLLFRVVPVPAGQHEVVFRFEPTSIRLGLGVTVVALLCALGLLVAASRAQSRRRTTSGEPGSLELQLEDSSRARFPH